MALSCDMNASCKAQSNLMCRGNALLEQVLYSLCVRSTYRLSNALQHTVGLLADLRVQVAQHNAGSHLDVPVVPFQIEP